jgi:hypothetical protein
MIIGAASGYDFDSVELWANSIVRSGFDGEKVLIVGDVTKNLIDKVTKLGFKVLPAERASGPFHITRFNDVAKVLDKYHDVRNVVFTDVRDVVFQANPSNLLELFMDGKGILVGAENFTYGVEPWSRLNMIHMFGREYQRKLSDTPVYCCGVIAGERESVADMLRAVYLICQAPIERDGSGAVCDQSGMNVLLTLKHYKDNTRFIDTNYRWVCHLGTTMRAIEEGRGDIGANYKGGYISKDTVLKEMVCPDVDVIDDLVCTKYGDPFVIVHQYDRSSEIKAIVEKKFR